MSTLYVSSNQCPIIYCCGIA